MAHTAINGIELYYETAGAGAPLMLVAGLASDSQSWQPVLAGFAEHNLVITPDNRGTGRTTPQDAPNSIRQMADDCMALAGELGLSSFHLLGHSMGGFVALDLAARYPDAVDRLILASTAAADSRRNDALFANWAASLDAGLAPALWWQGIFPWLFTTRFFDEEANLQAALAYALEYPYPQNAAAFSNQVEAMAGFDGAERLGAITAKALVIAGREDLLFPPDESIRLTEILPNASFRLIEEAAHSIHLEQPGAFIGCVQDFLGSDPADKER